MIIHLKKKILVLLSKYPLLKNKYILTSCFFIIWIIFFDTNSYYNQKKLEKEEILILLDIEKNKKMIEQDKKEIQKLKTIEGLEYVAREEYWMKKDNEDLFIIEIKNN